MKPPLLYFLPLCILSVPGHACLWDRDTLVMEKARFPEAADVIAGKFPRHSREFYAWRRTKSEAAVAQTPDALALYDDLAVAQHKLGDHRAAIATMHAKEKVKPGIYETYSNLGTFHIYTGELEEALKWIDRALAINPNAHFGREKYQRWLVEWVQAGKPQHLEALEEPAESTSPPVGFARFILEKAGGDVKRGRDWGKHRAAALQGVLGMMRFADFDNPLLLEALGDVLMAGEDKENAGLLAAQAYLHGSRRSTTDAEKQRLWKKMESAGRSMDSYVPRDTVRTLDIALLAGQNLAKAIRANEIAWIRAGKDASAEFEKKYLKAAE